MTEYHDLDDEFDVPCGNTITLYFIGDPNESISAFNGLFSDKVHYKKRGVLLRNLPYVDRYFMTQPEDMSLLRVLLHGVDASTLFHDYEIVELGHSVRKFVIPAMILMQKGRCEVELLTRKEWNEELSFVVDTAWNQYPPGEPITTITHNLKDKLYEITNLALREDDLT